MVASSTQALGKAGEALGDVGRDRHQVVLEVADLARLREHGDVGGVAAVDLATDLLLEAAVTRVLDGDAGLLLERVEGVDEALGLALHLRAGHGDDHVAATVPLDRPPSLLLSSSPSSSAHAAASRLRASAQVRRTRPVPFVVVVAWWVLLRVVVRCALVGGAVVDRADELERKLVHVRRRALLPH